MGKKNKSNSNIGRVLIKDRFGGNKGRKLVSNNSMLHTTEIQDGYDWGRLNLQSVTEESSFQEFLATAELAGTEFQAEKLNIKFINPRSNVGLLSKDEFNKAKTAHAKLKDFLRIPRRPQWDATTTPEQLDQNEKEYFLEWRRGLAKLQEDESILLTPYEKNLEFWRQLWRVVERSDVIVQIVDARNPLLFRCEDLECYVKEVSADKMNVILINKADFLTETQRQYWADYFSSIGVKVLFFSATLVDKDDKDSTTTEDNEEQVEDEEEVSEDCVEDIKEKIQDLEQAVERVAEKLNAITENIAENYDIEDTNSEVPSTNSADVFNTNKLLSRLELIAVFKNIHDGPKVTENITTIGLVGYPNVGKSSTINALISAKKVSVSATPGKTKHFQTLYLDKDILLCDCPGLVMPSFVFTKAEMILNGILPIDQMRDHVPPVNLVTSLIPRHVLEDKYGIMIPLPMDGEDPDRSPTAEELLNAHAYNRGFMTANGQPDNPRSARYILKDYMNGKLLYCHAPPGVDHNVYQVWPSRERVQLANKILPPRQQRATKSSKMSEADVDRGYFGSNSNVHVKGRMPGSLVKKPEVSEQLAKEKPWKQINKHENKKKKEKLRRVYAHLDQH